MKTFKQQMKETAAYANLTPRVAEMLHRFFLNLATDEEHQELDDWIHESQANDQLFDLLVDLNRDGPGAATPYLLNKFVKKEPKKPSRLMQYLPWILLGILIILEYDHVSWNKPLTTFFYGSKEGGEFVTKVTESGNETKVFWLYDSTRVELFPHSKLGYPDNFDWHPRRVKLWGSAKFEVRRLEKESLQVKSGNLWTEIEAGSFTIMAADTGNIIVQPHQ